MSHSPHYGSDKKMASAMQQLNGLDRTTSASDKYLMPGLVPQGLYRAVKDLTDVSPMKNAADWQNTKMCQHPGCTVVFNALAGNGRHHCRATGFSFCESHAPMRHDAAQIWKSAKGPVRLCASAYDRLYSKTMSPRARIRQLENTIQKITTIPEERVVVHEMPINGGMAPGFPARNPHGMNGAHSPVRNGGASNGAYVMPVADNGHNGHGNGNGNGNGKLGWGNQQGKAIVPNNNGHGPKPHITFQDKAHDSSRPAHPYVRDKYSLHDNAQASDGEYDEVMERIHREHEEVAMAGLHFGLNYKELQKLEFYAVWGSALAFLVSCIAFFVSWIDLSNDEVYVCTLSLSTIALLCYISKGIGQGSMILNGIYIPHSRYLDWLLTTPLMLKDLTALANSSGSLTLFLVVVDMLIISLGFIAAISTKWAHKCTWYFAATVLYCLMSYALQGPLTADAEAVGGATETLFSKLKWITLITWSFYPLVVMWGPNGVYVRYGFETETIMICFLDMISKIMFEFVILSSDVAH